MIPAETRYETHNSELLTIVEAFKTWRHYLKGSQHEVLVFTNHNNLWRFIDTKSLSFRQVYWAQKLSCYHFQIDYRQNKANRAANTLFWYPQRSAEKEKTLRAENVKILYRLQSSLTNASLSGLSTSAKLLPLHQVLIRGTYILPQLWQFWSNIQSKIALDAPYASIGDMKLQLLELQDSNKKVKALRTGGLLEGWQDVERVL